MRSWPGALLLSLFTALPPELGDAGFRALQPSAWSALVRDLPAPDRDRTALQVAEATARETLDELGIEGVVTGRVKSLVSTWRKMERKGVDVDRVYDRIAVRVRVDEPDDCYRVLGALHDRLPAVPGELDDYIATPKPSGYRSLHTALYLPMEGPTPAVAEVQIRTHHMHAEAEGGTQAHWRYKLQS